MNRWCEACGHEHGPLYDCPAYAPELRAQIHTESEEFIANLRTMPPSIERDIFLFFAGEE